MDITIIGTGNMGRAIATRALAGGHTVTLLGTDKAFNTTFAGTLVQGEVAGQPLDVLVAADDEEAKRTVSRLAEDAGLRAVDAGPLAHAQQLEGLGYLHMAIQDSLGTGYGSTIKVLA
jgi:predicted dinucleotide-binding enzyme